MALVKTVRLNIFTAPGDSKAKLDAISAKADELASKNPEVKVKIDTAAASVKLQLLRHELKNTGSESVTLGTRISGLTSSLSGLGRVAGGAGKISLFSSLAGGAAALSAPLLAAGAALGAFAALAGPTLSKVGKALTATGAAGKKAWADLDPAQRGIAKNLESLKKTFDDMAKAFEPVVAAVIGTVSKLASALLPSLTPLARAGASIIQTIVTPLTALVRSNLFKDFIAELATVGVQAGILLGKLLTGALRAIIPLFEALAPVGLQLMKVLQPLIVQLFGALGKILPVLGKGFAALVKAVVPLIGPLVKVAISLLPIITDLGKVVVALTPLIRLLADGLAAVITHVVVPALQKGIIPALNWLTGAIQAVVTYIRNHWKGIWDGALGVIKGVWNWIKDSWHHIEGWLEAPFKAAAKIIGGIFRTISGWIHAITGFLSSGHGPAGGSGGGVGGRIPGGSGPQATAQAMLPAYGWDPGQMTPLNELWTQESGWRWNATNPTSGAYGIPQALPASKMASAGADWRTNPVTQIRWGLGYIKGRYGSPSGAWAHEQAFNWYGNGLSDGLFTSPTLIGVGERGPERVSVTPAGRAAPAVGNTYNITVNVAPGGNMREAGREIVKSIIAYEGAAGSGWRS